MSSEEEKMDYNEEPVFYCTKCLSLNILSIDEDMDYCDDCGSTSIETINIEDWENLYYNRYNKHFI